MAVEEGSAPTAAIRSVSCPAAPFTVTVNFAVTGLLRSSASTVVHVTVVVPIANSDPDAGRQPTVGVSLPSSTAVGGV